jgi:hypothetical protein
LAGEARQGELVQGGFDRAVGVLQIDIMVPENSGTQDLNRVGDYLKGALSKKSFVLANNAVLNFRVGSHRYIGVSEGMARQSFRVGYWRDDRKLSSA